MNIMKGRFYQLTRFLESSPLFANKKIIYRANPNISLNVAEAVAYCFEDHILIEHCVLGLLGIQSILPDHDNETVLKNLSQKNFALFDFLTIFDHRLSQLYYLSWSNMQFYIAYEKNISKKEFQDFTINFLLNYLGVSSSMLVSTDLRDFMLYHSHILSHPTRTAEGLRIMLSDYFDIPIQILECEGKLVELDHSERSRLHRDNHFNQLGYDAILGTRMRQTQHYFVIQIGPILYDRWLSLLPNKPQMHLMREIIQLYCGIKFQFKMNIQIQYQDIPRLRLNQSYLGWNSWLMKKILRCQ